MKNRKRERVKASEDLKEIDLLFVEDEEQIRESFCKMIARKVNNFYMASNGIEGLELFKKNSPQIIISDVQMPKMNGLEMAEKIREIDKDVKIMIVSAFNDSEYLFKAIENDVSGYLVKPINKVKLYKQLNDLAKMILYESRKNKIFEIVNQVINHQENMVIVVGENRVKLANQEFLNYFKVRTFKEFNENINLCKEFLRGGEYFFADSVHNLDKCIEEIKFEKIKNNVIVSMRDKRDNNAKDFLVKLTDLSGLDGHTQVMTFTNVTDISQKSRYYQKKATYDDLTKIYNKAKFNELFEKNLFLCRNRNLDLSLILFDIDNFKLVNEKFGHIGGDKVLAQLAQLLREQIGSTYIYARWGGEEFIILLPKTGIEKARDRAETLRLGIETHTFKTAEKITCSFGVAQIELTDTIESCIARADKGLYKAKEAGRNVVIMCD